MIARATDADDFDVRPYHVGMRRIEPAINLLYVVAMLFAISARGSAAEPPSDPRTDKYKVAMDQMSQDPEASFNALTDLAKELKADLQLHTDDVPLRRLLGNVHVALGNCQRSGTGGAADPDAARQEYEAAIAADAKAVPAFFYLGVLAMDAKQPEEAITQFQKAVSLDPDLLPARNNLGQVLQTLGRNTEALIQFNEAHRLAPEDWKIIRKQIQCAQAAGKLAERDAARADIFKLDAAGKVDSTRYCCEQFKVNGVEVIAYEVFKPKAPEHIHYAFILLRPGDGQKHDRLSVGSLDSTVEGMRQLGELKADERLYHLDGYLAAGGHDTYCFFETEPTYETVRPIVQSILEGKTVPVSGIRPGVGGKIGATSGPTITIQPEASPPDK